MSPPAAKKSSAKRAVKSARSAKSSSSKKTVKPAKRAVKSSLPTGRIPSAARKVPRSRKSSKSAGSIEVVRPPVVDVTPEMKKDIIVVKPEPVTKEGPAKQPVEKHEDFAKALTQEPEKKGFLSRLFGRN